MNEELNCDISNRFDKDKYKNWKFKNSFWMDSIKSIKDDGFSEKQETIISSFENIFNNLMNYFYNNTNVLNELTK